MAAEHTLAEAREQALKAGLYFGKVLATHEREVIAMRLPDGSGGTVVIVVARGSRVDPVVEAMNKLDGVLVDPMPDERGR